MIRVYNRKTKEYEVEKVAGQEVMKYLYSTTIGKVGLEVLLKRKMYSALSGFACDTKLSAKKIRGFIEAFDIDMSICQTEIESFNSFNDFFTRKLEPTARPFSKDKDCLLSPGDGRLRVWTDIEMDKLIQVKGLTYSLGGLLQDDTLANKYQGGVCVLLRLAPVDYHRFHFIDDGICGESKRINGHYYSVNPIALESIPEVFCRNKREYCTQNSENFKDILYMEVGATSVGSIIQTYTPGTRVLRGYEKGYFKFGGSTVIMFLEKGVASIDEEILTQTEMGYETRVLAGEVIGKRQ